MKRKPSALVPGNTVGVVAPSGVVDRESLDRGVSVLESLGFKVKVYRSVLKRYGYLAGEDRDRAQDFADAWTDPDVHGVIAARGGYGATRMLRYLDFDALKLHKKVFVGYSDITALHLALWKHLRLVTFHGPMVCTGRDSGLDVKYNLDGLLRMIAPSICAVDGDELPDNTADACISGSAGGAFLLPEGVSLKSLAGGYAEGDLVGGNLSLVAASIGTDYEIDTKGKILFLEDVGEAPYRVDRMLCQLEAAGKFEEAGGFLLGDFTDCAAREGSPTLECSDLFAEYLTGRGKPCISGLPAGHGRFNATLSLGIRVALDAGQKTLAYLEQACS